MSERIRGLNCVRCQRAIENEGLSCTACGATHHATCYNAFGRCASCDCAKVPSPFAVAPRPATRTLAIAGLAIVAAMVLPLFVLGQRPAPEGQGLVAATGRAGSWQPKEQAARALKGSAKTFQLAQATRRTKSVNGSETSDVRAAFFGGKESRRSVVQLVHRPGRVSGSVSETIYPEGVQDSLEVVLDHGQYTDLFLCIDGRRGSGIAPCTALKVEVALSDRPVESPLETDRRWTALPPVSLGVAQQRWYRIASPLPFNRAKLALTKSSSGEAYVSSLIAAEATQPAGEVIECARYLTIAKLDGTAVTLANAAGQEMKVPRPLLTDFPAPDTMAITGPGCGGVLRVGRDGSVGMFSLQGNNASWGFDLGSLGGQHRVDTAARMFGPSMGKWLDEIGAWTILSRWPQAAVVDYAYDAAIETGFTLLSDGRVEISWPRAGGSQEMYMLQDLKAVVLSAHEDIGDPTGLFQRPRAYDERQRILSSRREFFAQGGRAEKEFIRFVATEVVPRFSKLAKEPAPLLVGDRVILTWRRYATSRSQQKALTIVMLGQPNVVVRNEALTAIGDSEEMDFPAAFLPPAPPPHVGQALVIYRADDLVLRSRVNTAPATTVPVPKREQGPVRVNR